jgi:DNA-binding NarL/FixJ family response regulator
MKSESIPILLVEDSPADIEIIRRSLKKGRVANPVHVARDGEEALEYLHEAASPPGVLIVDIHLPKLDGVEVLKKAKQIDPDTVVIMLTGHASLQTAVESLRRGGAFDYIEKSKDDLPQLVQAVRLAVEQRALRLQTHWTLSNGDRDRVIDMTAIREKFDLSEREIDVIKQLCRGNANKEIADRLFISELTVKGHLKNIYQKTNVHNRATLVSKILASAALPMPPANTISPP